MLTTARPVGSLTAASLTGWADRHWSAVVILYYGLGNKLK